MVCEFCSTASRAPKAANRIMKAKAAPGGMTSKIRAAANTVRYSTATPAPCRCKPKSGRSSRCQYPTASNAAPAAPTVASRASIGNSPEFATSRARNTSPMNSTTSPARTIVLPPSSQPMAFCASSSGRLGRSGSRLAVAAAMSRSLWSSGLLAAAIAIAGSAGAICGSAGSGLAETGTLSNGWAGSGWTSCS